MSVMSRLKDAGVEVYNRTAWGSPQQKAGAYYRRRATHPMPSGPAPYHFLHITVTADTDTVAAGAAGAQQIERYGYSTPPMVSYHDLVTNEGRYFEGQSYGVKGTHTINDNRLPGYPHDLNAHGYATALMQNVGDAVTDRQIEVVAMVMAARELEGLVKVGAPIYPHRMFAAKSCPGDLAVNRLPEIRDLKAQYVRRGLPGGVETLPKRIQRTITEIGREIVRVRAARKVAKAKGESPESYTAAVIALRAARKAARSVPKR